MSPQVTDRERIRIALLKAITATVLLFAFFFSAAPVAVAAPNQPPVNTVPSAQTTNEDIALLFSGDNDNIISASDPDAGTNPVKVTLSVTNGMLTLAPPTTDLSFTTGDGTNDATMTFTGKISDINESLEGLTFTPTANYNGGATLTITTNDQGHSGTGPPQPKTDTDTVSITINAVNDAPTISLPGGSLAYTENDAPKVIDSTATASDIDSTDFNTGTLAVDFSAGGTADDRLATHNEGRGSGQIGVSGSNVTYGGATIGTFTGGSGTTPLVVTFNSSSSPAAAQALMRNITYANVSAAPSTTARTVRFVLTDGDGGTSNTVTKTINVTATNDAPPITSVTADTPIEEGSSSTITVTATDPESDSLSYEFDCNNDNTFETGPQSGNTSQCTFTDDGAYQVNVRVSDGNGGSTTGSTNVIVNNVPPSITAPSNQSASEGTSSSFNLGSFTDPGTDGPWAVTVDWGDGSTDTTFTSSTAGTLGQQSYTYSDEGTHTVTVTVAEANSGTQTSDTETFTITVSNVAPTVNAGADETIAPGESFSSSGSFTDPGTDDTWTATVDYGDGSSTQALALNADKTFDLSHTYANEGDYTVTVTVTDDDGGTGSDTLLASVFVNDPPSFELGGDQAVNEDAGQQTVPNFATNISAGSGEDDQDVTFDVQNDNGALFSEQPAISLQGTLTYAPASNANGMATVTVVARDDGGTDDGGDDASDPQTFEITVNAVNDPPIADDDTATTNEDTAVVIAVKDGDTPGPSNESDQSFSVTNLTNPAKGTVEIIASGAGAGKVRYTPDNNYVGTDSFEYTVCDNGTPSECATAMVNVNVTAVNDVPVAKNDSYETKQNKTLKVSAPGVLKNDTDNDNGNEDFSAKVDQGPKKGELSLDKNGSFTYKPNFGFNGKDSFIYRISDGEDGTDTATVTITVRDTTAPAVIGLRVTGNSARPTYTVTFSEAMDKSTVNKNTFALIKKGTTKSVAATVRYDAANKKAVLKPNNNLRPGTTYVLTVKGGSRGAKDLAGNALARDKTWTFKV